MMMIPASARRGPQKFQLHRRLIHWVVHEIFNSLSVCESIMSTFSWSPVTRYVPTPISVSNNTANAAFAYFGISLFTLAICFASFFLLKKQVRIIFKSSSITAGFSQSHFRVFQRFYQYYSKRAMQASAAEGADKSSGPSDYLDAFKQVGGKGYEGLLLFNKPLL